MIFVALFAVVLVAGYATRSYVGVLLPLTLFVLAVIDFLSWERPAPGGRAQQPPFRAVWVFVDARGLERRHIRSEGTLRAEHRERSS